MEKIEWRIGDKIDCLDTVNKWLDASIKDIRFLNNTLEVLVTYTGFSTKFDEWI
jgi:hypothetical protein